MLTNALHPASPVNDALTRGGDTFFTVSEGLPMTLPIIAPAMAALFSALAVRLWLRGATEAPALRPVTVRTKRRR
jgi:hypothetical protein